MVAEKQVLGKLFSKEGINQLYINYSLLFLLVFGNKTNRNILGKIMMMRKKNKKKKAGTKKSFI